MEIFSDSLYSGIHPIKYFLCYIFTTRKRSLGQGNVFTGVCLSTGVCLEGSACGSALGDLPHLLFFHTTEISKQSHLQRGLHLGGWRGVCPQGFCPGDLRPRGRWVCIWGVGVSIWVQPPSELEKWAVRIILECFLVFLCFYFCKFYVMSEWNSSKILCYKQN